MSNKGFLRLFWAVALVQGWGSAAAQVATSPITYPAESCHAVARDAVAVYSTAPLNQSSYEEFQTQQTRWDIFCFGENLVIEQPIRSNGGSIVLVANRLEVSAPIDSRPYFKASESRPFYIGLPEKEKFRDGSQDLIELFRGYYTKAPDAVKIGNEVWLPELPSGTTGISHFSCENPNLASPSLRPALPPPDSVTQWDTTRPGDIVVFASSIKVNPSTLGSRTLYTGDPLDCGAETGFSGAAFIASGLRGGRGGVGGALAPFGDKGVRAGGGGVRNPVRFRCADETYLRPGLLNVAGGRGGPGGNVSLYLVNTTISEAQQSDLAQYIAVGGGSPGSTRKVRTPAWKGTKGPKSLDACGFLDEQPRWDAAASGEPGTRVVRQIGASEAFVLISRLILTRDARTDYNFKELLLRAEADSAVLGLSFESYFERRLLESIVSAQGRLAILLAEDVAAGNPSAAETLPPLFHGLSIDAISSAPTPPAIASQLRYLAAFDAIGGSTPRDSYFANIGGVLNLRNRNAYADWNAIAQRAESASIPTKLDELRKTLVDIASSVNDIRRLVLVNDYKASIASLVARINEVEELTRRQAGGNLDLIVASLTKASKAGAAFAAAAANNNVGGAALSTAEFLSAVDDYNRQVIERSIEISTLPELRAALAGLTAELDAFLALSASERARLTRERERAVLELLDSRVREAALIASRGSIYGDLVGLSIASWATDPARNRTSLLQNLEGVRTLVLDYPARQPNFSLSSLADVCAVTYVGWTPLGCQVFKASAVWRVVEAAQDEGWLAGMPLYVLAPSTQDIVLSTFRLGTVVKPLTGESDLARYWPSRGRLLPSQ